MKELKYNVELHSSAFSKLQKSLEIILIRYFKPPVWSASLSKCHSSILEPSMRRKEEVYLSSSKHTTLFSSFDLKENHENLSSCHILSSPRLSPPH